MFVFIVALSATAMAATYYSRATGNWNTNTTWSLTSGGAAVGAGIYPVAGDAVTIERDRNVTVTANAACATITFSQDNNASNTVTINSGITLTVSGAITIPRAGNNEMNTVAVGAGILNAGSIAFTIGGNGVRHQITISTGTVTVTGDVTTDNTGASASIIFTDAGTLNAGVGILTTTTVGGTLTTFAGSTVNYNGTAQTVHNFTYNNLTLSGSGAKTTTGITVNGILSMEGTATISAAPTYGANATLQYKGSAGQITGAEFPATFGGSGGVIIDNANGVSLNAARSISSNLTLTSGALTTTTTNLLTITNTAVGSITGASFASYINGPLAMTLLANIAADGTTYSYPVGENGNYRPFDLVNIRTGITAPVVRVTINGTGASTCDETTITNIAPRNWYVQNTSGIFTSASVRLTENGLASTNSIGQSSVQAGNYVYIGGANIGASITSLLTVSTLPAYFAIGTSLIKPLYSYQSGDWDVTTSWTTDPSGTLWLNPRIPGSLDNVTILNGRTISINANSKNVTALTINAGGILDIQSTTGHNFGTVTGQGKMMLSSNVLPGGAYTSFVASNGGTIEYYNLNNVSITTTQFTYNNLIISNYTSNAYRIFLNNGTNPTDYIINGNITLKNYSSGSDTLFFGNPTASDNLINMTVSGDFSVDAGCNIKVNNFAGVHTIPHPTTTTTIPYPIHTLSLYGNFTNNGSVRFTGLPSPVANAYYILTTTASGGINYGDVQVFFYGAANNTVTCNGTTDFFRFIVAKGTDKTYTLEVNSSNPNNFALYAPNDQGNSQFDGLPEGFGYGAYYKALFIHYGTLKLNENINIPSISEGGQDFNLIPTAGFWINGANVSTTVSGGVNGTGYQAATLYGYLRISAGQFSTGDAAGIVLGTLGTPVILIEGTGILDVSQAWTNTGGNNQMSYIQKGGTANLRLQGENHVGPMLGLSNINSVFIMSGGNINFEYNTNVGPAAVFNIMDIQSQVGNYQVTGGTINLNLPSSATTYTANSTVPFYNLNISNRTGTGTTTVRWNTPNPSLNVLHDLTIGSNTLLNLNTSSIDLAVGHDFTITSGGTYTPGTAAANTTTFNGTGTQAFNNVGTITGGNLQNLTLANTADVTFNGINVTIIGNLTIGHGAILRDNNRTIFVQGNIVNSGTHFKPASGTGSIQLTLTAAQNISGDGTGSFNNLTLNKTGGSVTVTAGIFITGNLRLAGNATLPANRWSTLNIGSYSLTLDSVSNIYSDLASDTSFSNFRMIQTSGLFSDGGVSKIFSNTNAFNFPFGFYINLTYYYMPHSVQFSSVPTTYGTVTTRPVNARHPLAQGANNALTCYWKTTSTGFTDILLGSVINNYYYDYAASDYFVSGTEANYIPAVYLGNSTWKTLLSGVNTTTNQVSYTADSAGGEYTAGYPAAFGSVSTLYSIANSNWNAASTWSTTRGGTAGIITPNATTPVYICDGKKVTTTAAASAGSLIIETGSTLDLQNFTGHNFGSIAPCGGTLRIASTAYFPTGDWGNFLGTSGGTVEYYQIAAGTLNLPATITSYNNLITSPYNGSNVVLPNTNLTVYNNFTVGYSAGGGTSNCITQINAAAATTTLEVHGNININQYGILQYMNAAAENVIVDNDINIAADGALQVRNGGTSVANTLTVYGSITNNETFDLDPNATSGTYYCNLIFTGSLSKALTSTATPTRTRLYSMTVNKGTSRNAVLNVDVGPAGFQMGSGGLILQNGTFRLTTDVTMNLSTGSFNIPSTSCLSVSGGTFNIATGTPAADLTLAGRLEVLAGAINVGPALTSTSNAFNIIYASAGTPEIIVTGGTLNVYSQIRRGTVITSGSLIYTQTGGTVTIGGKNPSTSRAAFEVLNDGIFTMSNGTLIVANHISAVSPYDLYLDPGIENVTGGTIQFGLSGVTTSNTFYFQSSCSIGNITLEASTNSSATQEIYELTLLGNLTIGGATSFYNTYGLDVTIGGNLTNNNTTASTGLDVGGFRAHLLTQSTGFIGNANQTITGTGSNLTNFANLDVSTAAGQSLSLSSSNITVNGDMTLTSGTLNDGGNTINLLNNVDNNAVHNSLNATSGGMVFIGTTNQGMTGSGYGVFGNIEINNGGKGINMTDNSTVKGQVKFTNGYFYIDNYLLTLDQNATIAGTLNASNLILLNGVLSDEGVKKIFPSTATSFTFPVGDNGKYTPCTFNFTSYTNGAGATIKVVPVDQLHPSINPASYSNYLNYYWNVVTTGFSSAYSVTHTYTYIPADIEGNPANIERCDNSTSIWSTPTPIGTITPPTFSFNSTSLLDGGYTIGDPFSSLPLLYSIKSGNWFDPLVWSTSSVPNGNPVRIELGHSVALSADGAYAASVLINGVLDAKNTTFHNLGQVSGTGTIKLEGTGTGMFKFPGGSYDDFFANPSSTIEFYGITNSTLPSNLGDIYKPYQNVILSGTGIKYMSSINMKINGNLTISSGSKLDNTPNNKDLTILGNWIDQNTVTSGFNAGTGTSTVRFNGTTAQSISINIITESFNNLAINNAAGLTLQTGNADVNNQLILTSGNINTSSAHNLTINNIATNAVVGGSVNSFVNGPMRKQISNSSNFRFPVGDAISSGRNRIGYVSVSNTAPSGTQIWTAQFFDKNPTTGGYDITKVTQPIISVVDNEYWNIIGPSVGSPTANVALNWDQYSGMNSDPLKRSVSGVAEWNTPVPSSWISVGDVVTDNGQYLGTVATSIPVSLGNHIFTISTRAPLFTATQNGLWNNPLTWGGVGVPSFNDAAKISTGITVTLNITTTITKLIVDNGGGTFNNSTNTLTITGNLELNGIWTGSGGKISMTSSTGTIFGSGTMTGTCTLEIAGNKIIDAAASLTLTNVSILNNETLKNNGMVTIDDLTGAANSTFVNASGSTLVINGQLLATGTFDAGTCPNTVIFNGTIPQIVKQATYCNIIISGVGAKAINDGATITAHGDVTQQSGTPFTVGVITFQIDGGLITGDNFVNNGDITIGN